MMATLVVSSFSPLIPQQTANAAGSMADSLSLPDQVTSFMYYRTLGSCVTYNGSNLRDGVGFTNGDWINQTDAKNGAWFADTGFLQSGISTPGAYLKGIDGITLNNNAVDCSKLVNGALKLWGSWAPDQALCAMGFRRVDDGEFKAGRCTDAQGGTDQFMRDNVSKYAAAVKNRVYGGKEPSLSSEAKYLLYLKTFQTVCAPTATISTSPLKGTTTRDYSVRQPSRVGTGTTATVPITTTYYVSRDNMQQSDVVSISPGTNLDTIPLSPPDFTTCGDLVKAINGDPGKNNGLADAYAKWLHDHTAADISGGPTICAAGATVDPVTGKPCSTTSTSSCAIDGVGWILCPILTAGAGLADGAYKFLADSFLATDPSLVNTNPEARTADGKLIGTGTYTAWKIMQGIGNVAFIIAVLIIIFSQLTSVGISNYGVKKLLPRVIVAAILVNLSFLICQVAVDVSNILGYSLKGLLEGVAHQVTTAGGGAPASAGDDSTNLAGIAATVLIIGSAAWINVGALVVAVAGAIVALLTIFVLLIARKVLIVLLIMVAPLAFVAYLLPNTEPLFQRWRKMLTGLLLLFPVIGMLYGACLLASAVLLQVAGDDPVLKIAAYMALVIPLIAAIPLLKGSLDGVGKLGGAIQSFGQKARGIAQGGAKGSYDRSRLGQFKKYRDGENARRRALIQSGQFRGSNANPRNWFRNPASKVNQGINAVSGQFGDRATAEGISLANKAEAESVGFQEQALRRQGISNPDAAKIALDKAVRSGDAVAAKAAQNVLFTQGAAGMNAFHSTIAAAEADGSLRNNAASALRENINVNHGQMVKTKAADISKWAALGGSLQGHTQSKDSWAGMSQSDLAAQTGDSLKRGANAEGIDATAAAALLNNPQLNGGLDDKQRAALRQAAGEASSSGSGVSAPTPSPGPIGAEVVEPSGWLPPAFPEAPGPVPHESFTDEQGRRTPTEASDDYHDRMTK